MPTRQVRGRRKPGAGTSDVWMDPLVRGRLPVLGVDIGGVIVDRVAENSDTSFFGNRPLETPAVSGAIEALQLLTSGPFGWRVHLISKAGPKTAATTREWLEHVDFFGRTGIARHQLHFVGSRREKAPVCERLGVTHFVDDRLDVLAALTAVRYRYLFTGGLGRHRPPESVPGHIQVVDTWTRLRELITIALPG